jgi:hypothetical protein
MSGVKQRRKGDRVEREIVALHRALGTHSEPYPLSGASRFRNSGHDIDIYVYGREAGPAVAEVRARKNGAGWTVIERPLGLFEPPLVVLPWRVWTDLIQVIPATKTGIASSFDDTTTTP